MTFISLHVPTYLNSHMGKLLSFHEQFYSYFQCNIWKVLSYVISTFKVKSAGVENVKKMGMLMSKCMTPDDVDNVSIDDLGLNCSSSTGPTFTPDKATVSFDCRLFTKYSCLI